MRRLFGDDFFMFQQDGTPARQHATLSLSWKEREMRETRRRLSACVSQNSKPKNRLYMQPKTGYSVLKKTPGYPVFRFR